MPTIVSLIILSLVPWASQQHTRLFLFAVTLIKEQRHMLACKNAGNCESNITCLGSLGIPTKYRIIVALLIKELGHVKVQKCQQIGVLYYLPGFLGHFIKL